MDDFSLELTDTIRSFKPDSEHNEEGCLSFSEYQEVAAQIVNDVLETAVIKLSENSDVVDESRKLSMAGNFIWPSIESFTPDFAVQSMTDFIYYNADLTPDWMFVIKESNITEDVVSDFYEYEVMFSLPTRSYPVPQVTASLFFTFEVSRAIDPSCPVRVTYRVEGSQRALTPMRHVINEEMLMRTMESKLCCYREYRW